MLFRSTIPFNKILGIHNEFDASPLWTCLHDWCYAGKNAHGIYLTSIHDKNGRYIRELCDEICDKNLLIVENMKKLARIFGKEWEMPVSQTFNRETDSFYEWSGFGLFPSGRTIKDMKMTKFVEIIKSFVFPNSKINLIDSSCYVARDYGAKAFYELQHKDLENAGGKKKRTRKRKSKRKKTFKNNL